MENMDDTNEGVVGNYVMTLLFGFLSCQATKYDSHLSCECAV